MKNKIEMKFIIISIVWLVLQFIIISAATATPAEEFKKYALRAQLLEIVYGVPASIQLAQSYCETRHGKADPIGTVYNNWFAIMDFKSDYWEYGSGEALNWNKTKYYIWRRYSSPLISWIDHAYFLYLHNPEHRYKPYIYWIKYPVKYGRSGYWIKIQRTILKYNLQKYDIYK